LLRERRPVRGKGRTRLEKKLGNCDLVGHPVPVRSERGGRLRQGEKRKGGQSKGRRSQKVSKEPRISPKIALARDSTPRAARASVTKGPG